MAERIQGRLVMSSQSRLGCRFWAAETAGAHLFSIERGDETALFDPLDEGWINNPIRIGLFRCSGTVSDMEVLCQLHLIWGQSCE